MKNFAILDKDNHVENILTTDVEDYEYAISILFTENELIEINEDQDVYIGSFYDGKNFCFLNNKNNNFAIDENNLKIEGRNVLQFNENTKEWDFFAEIIEVS